MNTIAIVSLLLGIISNALAIYSSIQQKRANEELHGAIIDLHESHDELHELLKETE